MKKAEAQEGSTTVWLHRVRGVTACWEEGVMVDPPVSPQDLGDIQVPSME